MRLIGIISVLIFVKLCSTEISPVVNTALGKIKGHYRTTAKNIKYEAYEGIPYALPPLRGNRFLPPRPVKAWKDVVYADKARERCWGYEFGKIQPGNEDCLYLNVYVPEKKTLNRTLPVIVYIHGGAFQFSEINGTEQNNFMHQNVIFVTMRYRLGAFGFLSTEDDIVPDNMGLKDQAMALKWIKTNIESFGGDSNRITLVGESAGGASIHYHYLSPMSKGLFSYGISISGTALMPWTQTKNSRKKAFKLGKILNCNTNDTRKMVECLKYKSPRSLTEALAKFTGWGDSDFTPFGPVIEKSKKNAFINCSPIKIISTGGAQKLPWITSTVSEEGLIPLIVFCTNNSKLKELDENWESIAPQLLQYHDTVPKSEHSKIARKVRRYYLGNEPIDKKTLLNLTHLVGDRIFAFDSIKAAKLQAKTNSVWYYHFTYRPSLSLSEILSHSKDNLGTSHADDLLLTYRELGNSEKEVNDLKVQKKLINLWVSMAYNGTPNFGPNWQRLNFNNANFEYLKISGPENIKMVRNNKFANNQLWSSIHFNENQII